MLLTKPFTLQAQQVRGSSKLPLVPGHFPAQIGGDGHQMDLSARPRAAPPTSAPCSRPPREKNNSQGPHCVFLLGSHGAGRTGKMGHLEREEGTELSTREQR